METRNRDKTHVTRRDDANSAVADRGTIASTLTGQVRFHRDVTSAHLHFTRDVAVYLPPGYDDDRGRRYPVLYLQDGQNLFDAATSSSGVEWEVDETAERLIGEGRIEPVIIVAVSSTALRISEYTAPWGENPGIGDRYARFVVEELKPFVDDAYRTLPDREHAAIGGSSLGALVSLYVCGEFPDAFSKCIALSPAIWWQREVFLERLKLRDLQVFMTVGTREGRSELQWNHYLEGARGLRALMRRDGLDHHYREVESGRHHESEWQSLFADALLGFYGTK